MMKLITFLIFTTIAYGQDERVLREMFSHERIKSLGKKKKVHFKVRSNRYAFDLNDDHRPESFFFAKRDGEDWLFIDDYKGNRIFNFKFDTLAALSRAYKIEVRYLTKKTKVFLIHYYEGVSHYIETRGTSRLYMLSIDDNNLKTLKMKKGPALWEEFKDHRDLYHQRSYKISLYDFNNDGFRDLAVRYALITRVFLYRPGGKWVRYTDPTNKLPL
jgi:hypothetical protein